MKKCANKAFTLIELLIVIAIITILSFVIIVSYQNAKARSRNNIRISDLNQYANALQLYYSDNKKFIGEETFLIYPPDTGYHISYLLGSDNDVTDHLKSYLNSFPTDPKYTDREGNNCHYIYLGNFGNTVANQYKVMSNGVELCDTSTACQEKYPEYYYSWGSKVSLQISSDDDSRKRWMPRETFTKCPI